MFKSSNFERDVKIENSGTVLESEYFGDLNKNKYAELVDRLKSPEKYKVESLEDVEKIMMANNRRREDYSNSYKDDSYLKYQESMDLVEQSQLGNPEKPRAFFAKALLQELNNLFEDKYKLKFFTAIGSHLDTKHGTDAFIKLYDEDDKEVSRATIDITGREKTNHTVDVIILVRNQEREIYDFDSDKFDKSKFSLKIKEEALIIKEAIERNRNLAIYKKRPEIIKTPERVKRPRINRPEIDRKNITN